MSEEEGKEKQQEEIELEAKKVQGTLSEDEESTTSGGTEKKQRDRSKSVSRTKSSKKLTEEQLERLEEQRVKELEESLNDPQRVKENRRESLIFIILILVIQVVVLVVLGAYGKYPEGPEIARNLILYPLFRDVNIMIFFGFGFLMTFLRRYGYSAIGYTLLISAVVVEYSLIVRGVVFNIYEVANGGEFTEFPVSLESLIDGLFCAGAVMISFGAILGKTSPTHLVILALIEPWFFFANVTVSIKKLEALDVGGGMTIHTLGAYYGVVMTFFLTSKQTRNHQDNTSNYTGDVFSLAGTLFLWLLWPSFNGAVASTLEGTVYAFINTFLSICSSTLAAFIVSRLLSENRFEVSHIQNATLAGGVVMGVAADLRLNPAGACLSGFVAGTASVLGYRYLTPLLSEKLNIQDVCGVHNLHGIPGFLSGLVGIFATISNNTSPTIPATPFPHGSSQAGYQAAALFVTLGFAIVGGLITGLILKLFNRVRPIPAINYYNDRTFWNLPSDYYLVVNKKE